ncbi:hypothetical protein E2562_021469 [Oryza meyeriana var. granulata]|uniref:Strictosidine synthase conserved region domain-containing protein n=1 Tax=Oryza meyeriana var. granulata TaxID=110450 RepID=A0A6G1E074_9ORYZ|nr:hypothetical protein E2562_021469 [Oryza meyeriana var. granulata]
MGLMKVGPNGGEAQVVATEADGVPFHFLNGLDADQATGDVYFTDSSSTYTRRFNDEITMNANATRRLLKYDAQTRQVTMVKADLSYTNGVTISSTGRTSTWGTRCRVRRFGTGCGTQTSGGKNSLPNPRQPRGEKNLHRDDFFLPRGGSVVSSLSRGATPQEASAPASSSVAHEGIQPTRDSSSSSHDRRRHGLRPPLGAARGDGRLLPPSSVTALSLSG